MFPSPQGHWPRRSNYRRNTFAPWAAAAGWPRSADGRRAWTFHSLRHVFATWALAQPGARIEDVSRLLGHSTVRVTQDLYISPDGDLFDASTGRRRRGRGRTDESAASEGRQDAQRSNALRQHRHVVPALEIST